MVEAALAVWLYIGILAKTPRRSLTRPAAADSRRLAVANMVEHAVKYSPPGRPVLVAASALADRVELRIVDEARASPTRPSPASPVPSSATETRRVARASAWAWRWPEASWRRWAAR
ncbi:hypothetical protein GCM10010272_13170 [Streptomyces lateritius]|nr:hypothetical protein GCM10010272_13170 [Streptomyces lateritius]